MQLHQLFKINGATGKKISLSNGPSENFLGNGAFTLVDGVQNSKGLKKQTEFLGFLGTDCEAVIDLGATQNISHVKVHFFHQKGTWIYSPQFVEVFYSDDGKSFTSVGTTQEVSSATGNAFMEKHFTSISTRYIKVLIKNKGDIEGNPYGGHKAWLLVDEIEVN
ncbi:discoidin domain-containing protein [Chitinophagaceae bacterium LB-8]|uniref:Discoidin domain-containing protein n=1 Tax=Paraflavisolibacter caeni TaxID=2982496 RepID=A0A9X2XWR2_9BACT|nr:discoidin domain-containing protein [Paraflavisolibacter caeni]MCU7550092.1 discoidin domain-containing protein [Paraflavisolibacter caeni]